MYNTNKGEKELEEILFLNKDSLVATGLLDPETEAIRFTKAAGKYLITPDGISSKTLASMDQAIRNLQLGQVSNPVDLSDFEA